MDSNPVSILLSVQGFHCVFPCYTPATQFTPNFLQARSFDVPKLTKVPFVPVVSSKGFCIPAFLLLDDVMIWLMYENVFQVEMDIGSGNGTRERFWECLDVCECVCM